MHFLNQKIKTLLKKQLCDLTADEFKLLKNELTQIEKIDSKPSDKIAEPAWAEGQDFPPTDDPFFLLMQCIGLLRYFGDYKKAHSLLLKIQSDWQAQIHDHIPYKILFLKELSHIEYYLGDCESSVQNTEKALQLILINQLDPWQQVELDFIVARSQSRCRSKKNTLFYLKKSLQLCEEGIQTTLQKAPSEKDRLWQSGRLKNLKASILRTQLPFLYQDQSKENWLKPLQEIKQIYDEALGDLENLRLRQKRLGEMQELQIAAIESNLGTLGCSLDYEAFHPIAGLTLESSIKALRKSYAQFITPTFESIVCLGWLSHLLYLGNQLEEALEIRKKTDQLWIDCQGPNSLNLIFSYYRRGTIYQKLAHSKKDNLLRKECLKQARIAYEQSLKIAKTGNYTQDQLDAINVNVNYQKEARARLKELDQMPS